MRTLHVSMALAICLSAFGCTPTSTLPKFSFEPVGAFDPGTAARAASSYEAAVRKPSPRRTVTVLQGQFPPGVRREGNSLNVTPESGLAMLGAFEVAYPADAYAPDERMIEAETRRIAAILDADVLTIRIVPRVGLDGQPTGKVHGLLGIAFRATAEEAAPEQPPTGAHPADLRSQTL
jgi:hypothetical protein